MEKSASWINLLKVAAKGLGVKFDRLAAESSPTVYWDSLVSTARQGRGRTKYRSNRDAERRAIKAVKEFIDSDVERAARRKPNATLADDILGLNLLSIVSLNFTLAPFGNKTFSRIASTNRVPGKKTRDLRVWLPHGVVSSRETIKLGAGAYRRVLLKVEAERISHEALIDGRGESHVSMVRDCLRSPLVFAGCGLSDFEWTLWGIIAMRARATRMKPVPPSWFLSVEKVCPKRARLFASLGIQVLHEPCADRYWEQLVTSLSATEAD